MPALNEGLPHCRAPLVARTGAETTVVHRGQRLLAKNEPFDSDLVVGRFRDQSRRIVLELQTNQWNAIIVDRSSHGIVNVLRGRRAGERSLFPGQPYESPAAAGRYGIEPASEEEAREVWAREVGAVPPDERRRGDDGRRRGRLLRRRDGVDVGGVG